MLEESNNKRKSLGRGLNALLGDDDISLDSPKGGKGVAVDLVYAGNLQPRTEFEPEALKTLAQSIKEKGVLQPLLVRRIGGGYELIAGERRWRAAKMAGLKEVPVIEKDFTDAEVLEAALVENLLRENLSAIEEAEGFQRLMNDFSYTQEALSSVVGKSRSHIANMLRLLGLPAEVQKFVKEGKLSAGHARALVGLENAVEIAGRAMEKDLSVRAVEELAARQKQGKKEPAPKAEKKNEDISKIEKDLVKSLGLRIKISPSKQGGGKVVLQYASVAELDMIIDILEQKKKAPNSVFKASVPQNNDKFTMKVVG
jgi:ParB family chromosome partitioning protein